MYRIILFLVLIALAAAGAAWVADQSGDVVLSWDGWRIATTLPVFALALSIAIVAAMLAWSLILALGARRKRSGAAGANAVPRAAVRHHPRAAGNRPRRFHRGAGARRCRAQTCRARSAGALLHAQSAQLEGNREGARAAFRAMAEREDTRLLGLRGLFIEAQRADDPHSAVMLAEER